MTTENQLQLDENGESYIDIDLNKEDLIRGQHEFMQRMLDEFDDAKLIEYNEVLDKYEELLNEVETSIVNDLKAKSYKDINDKLLDQEDERFDAYYQIAASFGPLSEAGKLPGEFTERLNDLSINALKMRLKFSSMIKLTPDFHAEVVGQLDQSMLNIILAAYSFQSENILRTLRGMLYDNVLTENDVNTYVKVAADNYEAHLKYAEFNDLDTTELSIGYNALLEVLESFKELI